MPDAHLPSRLPSAPLTAEARDRVAELLSARFADDSLTLEEFERRVALVYAAATETELAALTADLRAEPAVVPAPPAIAPAAAGAPRRLRVVLGNHERAGMSELPERMEIRVVAGNVELDFRDAALGAAVTEIDIDAIAGNVEITLPVGVTVENHGIGLLGSFECRPERGAEGQRTGGLVRITGRAFLSSVAVRFAAGAGGRLAAAGAHPPLRSTPG